MTQDALGYLYTDGTGYGTTALRTVHADFTGDLGEYGVKLPSGERRPVDQRRLRDSGRTVEFKPDEAEQSGLLSGFGGAAVAIDESIQVNEYFAELRVPLIQDKRGASGSQHRRRVPQLGLFDQRHRGHLEVRDPVRAGAAAFGFGPRTTTRSARRASSSSSTRSPSARSRSAPTRALRRLATPPSFRP